MSYLFDDASAQYISYGDTTIFDGTGAPLSGHAWCKLTDLDNDQCVFGKYTSSGGNSGFILYFDKTSAGTGRTNVWRALLDANAANDIYSETDSNQVSAGQWYSVGFRFNNAGRIELFVNGEHPGNNAVNAGHTGVSNNTADFRVGSITVSSGFNMSGTVADVALWRRYLSAADFKFLASGYRASHLPARRVFYDPLDSPIPRNKDNNEVGVNTNSAVFSGDEPPFIQLEPNPPILAGNTQRQFFGGAVTRNGFIYHD